MGYIAKGVKKEDSSDIVLGAGMVEKLPLTMLRSAKGHLKVLQSLETKGPVIEKQIQNLLEKIKRYSKEVKLQGKKF